MTPKANPDLQEPRAGLKVKILWALGALVVLTPLGILLPELLGSGETWGEWAPERLRELLGYVPEGLRGLSDLWEGPLKDYGQSNGAGGKGSALKYIASAAIGAALVGAAVLVIAKLAVKKDNGKDS